ncbi:hypothetical protein [Cryobacterium sp. SO1]|nr:hypothetical protein [Cryobacterium sp. SO1]RZI36923.1 hypothetical protein BJQ95_00668 [Cryobacterium sp. SO1]
MRQLTLLPIAGIILLVLQWCEPSSGRRLHGLTRAPAGRSPDNDPTQ